MFKFSMAELSRAAYPITAYQVALRVQAGNEKPVPCVEPVVLTQYIYAYDRLYFTAADGSTSHCNSINFFRSEVDAQEHIDFVYNWSPNADLISQKQ